MLIAVAAAVIAVLLFLAPDPARDMRRLAPEPTEEPVRRRLRFRWWWLPLALPPVAGFAIAGSTGLVLATSAELVGVTACWLLHRWRLRRQAATAADEIAHGCQVLAGQLRIGQVPTEALRVAAEDCPVLQPGWAMHQLGGDVVRAWRRSAHLPGHSGLRALSQAWQVSEASGAPMADVLNTVAEVLTSQRRVSGVLAGELAGPRATARLLAALPAVGVGLGMVLGGDPGGFLLHHPIGQVALLAGVALACAGLAWVDRISGKDQVT